MAAVFGMFYLVLVMAIIIACIFIVFHIARYSYNKTAKKLMLVVFITVAGTLLFVNLLLFMSLPLKEIMGNFISY